MTNENDDEPPRKPPLIKTHLRLVKDTTRSKPKLKKSKYSTKQKQFLISLFYLRTCRALVDGFDSATSSVSRMLPKIEFFTNCVRPFTDEELTQINIVGVLYRDLHERIQTLADFHGSLAEFVKILKRESDSVCGAARRLKAIEEYLAEAVRQRDTNDGAIQPNE
jgi:hypothetical protein